MGSKSGFVTNSASKKSLQTSETSFLDLIHQLKCMIHDDYDRDAAQVLEVKRRPSSTLPAERRRTYTREYLFWCSQYEPCFKFPKELAELQADLPRIIKPFGFRSKDVPISSRRKSSRASSSDISMTEDLLPFVSTFQMKSKPRSVRNETKNIRKRK